ncbi:MAG: flippase-like domain-containing protein [Prevotellaceae bacterium]|nr:flippase-like domain-containing protein [Prevotellaceae bacterium]
MRKESIKKILQIVGSFAIGFLIFYLVYKDQDLVMMKEELSKGNLFWIIFPVFLGASSHFVRALRWKQLIEPLGKSPRLINVYFAVMTGYFANYLLPRAGEVARCGVLKKYEDIPFTELLGTVIAERAFDLIILLCFIGAAIFTQLDVFSQIFASGSSFEDKFGWIIYNPIAWILTIVAIAFLFAIRKRLKELTFVKKGRELAKNVINGIKTFFKVKNKPLFLFYTAIIWLFYFDMLYLSFNAFDFTKELGVTSGLSTFSIGSLGIVAPVQGGIGAWHFLTIESLKFYGVAALQAATFAFVVHLMQTLMILIIGFISFVSLPFVNKTRRQ